MPIPVRALRSMLVKDKRLADTRYRVSKKKRLLRARKIALRRLPRQILPEIKKRDYFINGDDIDSTSGTLSQTSLFTNIPIGDAYNERTGNKIFVKYVVFKMLVIPSATVTWNAWRFAFHLDKEPMSTIYAATIPWTVMYVDTGSVTNNLNAPPNPTLTGRLKLVKNIFGIQSPHLIRVQGGPDPTPITSDEANPPKHYTFKIRINKFINFQTGSNEVQSGVKLYMTAWSNQNGVAAPILHMAARTYFTDA